MGGKPLGEAVADWLADEIAVGRLGPGTRITTAWVCEKLGVSTTPVREAFRLLHGEGIVGMESRRGVWVTGVRADEISDMYEVRAYLQGLAARQCAERATDEEFGQLWGAIEVMRAAGARRDQMEYWAGTIQLRGLIMRFGRNAMLSELGNRLDRRTRQVGFIAIGLPGRMGRSIDSHEDVVRLISARQGDKAEDAMRRLIRMASQELREALERR